MFKWAKKSNLRQYLKMSTSNHKPEKTTEAHITILVGCVGVIKRGKQQTAHIGDREC